MRRTAPKSKTRERARREPQAPHGNLFREMAIALFTQPGSTGCQRGIAAMIALR
jgi:hypothetical protein